MCVAVNSKKSIYRIPDFNNEVNPINAKYNDQQHFISVNIDGLYEIKTHPDDKYELWNRLFPN